MLINTNEPTINQIAKKIKGENLKEFKVFIMKFLTKHNKQVILEIINYSMFTTHSTHLPIAPTLRHLQFLQSPFFIGTDLG